MLIKTLEHKQRHNGYIAKKLIIINDENLMLTDEGKLFADGIASDLFSLAEGSH